MGKQFIYVGVADSLEEAAKNAMWGTYGPSGTDPLKYVKLVDCSTEHLLNIQKQRRFLSSPTDEYTLYINWILEQRK